MATSKNVKLFKTIKVRDPKTGKMYKKTVNKGTKNTNVMKGTNTNLTADKTLNDQILKGQKILADKEVQMAKVMSKAANTAAITAQSGQAIHDITGIGKQNTQSLEQVQAQQTQAQIRTTNADSGVQQSVNGGVQVAGNQRDEDDVDSPWID